MTQAQILKAKHQAAIDNAVKQMRYYEGQILDMQEAHDKWEWILDGLLRVEVDQEAKAS